MRMRPRPIPWQPRTSERQLSSSLECRRCQTRVETDVAAVLEARVVEQSAELAELKAASADADAKRKEAELRARTIEADLAAKVEAAAGDSEEVKALRSKVETFETDVAKLRADVEAKDAELEAKRRDGGPKPCRPTYLVDGIC